MSNETTDGYVPSAEAVEASRAVVRCPEVTPWRIGVVHEDTDPDGYSCGRPASHDGKHGGFDSHEWHAAWLTAAVPVEVAREVARVLGEVQALADGLVCGSCEGTSIGYAKHPDGGALETDCSDCDGSGGFLFDVEEAVYVGGPGRSAAADIGRLVKFANGVRAVLDTVGVPAQVDEAAPIRVRMLHQTPNHAKGQIGTLHDASPSGHVNEHVKWVDYGEPIQLSHGQSESTGEWCGPGEYEVVMDESATGGQS